MVHRFVHFPKINMNFLKLKEIVPLARNSQLVFTCIRHTSCHHVIMMGGSHLNHNEAKHQRNLSSVHVCI